jgi:hypothetical protein
MSDATSRKIGDAVAEMMMKATGAWAKQRKSEERDARRAERRYERLIREREVTVKEVAYCFMEQAYLAASANDTLPAAARQVMYAARPLIQAETGKALNDQYFTQTLLPDYMVEHNVDWNVVFDDRGHFVEPHTGHEIGIGTLSVRHYLAEHHEPQIMEAGFSGMTVSTCGPQGNYGAVLFIEKEGFMPLFEAVRLADRFDIAIKSTKGMSVTAARELAERLCGGKNGIPLLLLHDFDKAGFSIAATLQRDTRRYQFAEDINVVDIGLRLEDVVDLGLEGLAEAAFDKGHAGAREDNLRMNGASEDEIAFLLERRVELNALTSDRLVAFVKRKLVAHGIKKIIPDREMLARVYRSSLREIEIREIIERELAELDEEEDTAVPDNLTDQVAELLRQNPAWRWDRAIAEITGAADDDPEQETAP